MSGPRHRPRHRVNLRAGLFACGLLACLAAQAQDPTPDAPATPVQPRAAEIARLASRTLLLGIAKAGEGMIAVGDHGNILLSADGAKWAQVASPVNVTLTAVSFADARTGWIVGHDATVLRSQDGGRSWILQNFKPELGQPLLSVYAIDAQHALAIGAYGMFIGTNDGGASWNEVAAPAVRDDGLHLNSLIRLGDGSLLVVGETGLIATRADGRTWQRRAAPYEGSLFGALPRGQRGALVFGLRGNVYMTDDVYADRWTRVDIGSVQSMFGGGVLPDGRAVLAGSDGEIVYIAGDGRVTRAKLGQGAVSAGTLSGVLPSKDGLQVVGESGTRGVEVPD